MIKIHTTNMKNRVKQIAYEELKRLEERESFISVKKVKEGENYAE